MSQDENSIEIIQAGAVGEITKSEILTQIEAAHRYPRQIKRFLADAKTMATFSQPIAESCIFSMPRAGGQLTGPSIRLAEIAASTYGNLQIGARIVDSTGHSEVVAQGMAWDMERNVRMVVESRRSILTKGGTRFTNDMVVMTGNAAASIALRNSIFRIIPKCYIDDIYSEVKLTAIGDMKSFIDTRNRWIAKLNKAGITTERVLARLERPSVEDMSIDDIEVLIGLENAVKAKEISGDEAFPRMDWYTKPQETAAQAQSLIERARAKQPKPADSQKPADDPDPKTPVGSTDEAVARDVVEQARKRQAERKSSPEAKSAAPADPEDFDRG